MPECSGASNISNTDILRWLNGDPGQPVPPESRKRGPNSNWLTLSNLDQIADDISNRLISLFLPDAGGNRPVHGGNPLYQNDLHYLDLVLFYEYFHEDNGRGVGVSHQTGWTGLVAEMIDKL